jgi:glycosyltransferase involved in cell wall biosynthesis
VVTSGAGAGGVDAEDEAHFLVAKTPADAAAAALRLMSDAGERARLAHAGRARMLSHHDWSASMRRLDGIVERCMTEFAARRARVAA